MRTFLSSLVIVTLTLNSYTYGQERGVTLNTATQAPAAHAKRFALIIGNADYPQAPLKNPVNDAEDVGKALHTFGFEVLPKRNLKLREMKEAIRDFVGHLRSDAVGLFYYAGHGMQVRGENYLIPVDAEFTSEADVEDSSLNIRFLLEQLAGAGNDTNIIILDACRAAPVFRSFRSASRGLAQVIAPQGTFIAYATAPGSVASDGTEHHGIYTQELLERIGTPSITIEELFRRVRASVWERTRQHQLPWDSSSLFKSFYFVDGQSPVLSSTGIQTVDPPHPPQSMQVNIVQPVSLSTENFQFWIYKCTYARRMATCPININNQGRFRTTTFSGADENSKAAVLTDKFGNQSKLNYLQLQDQRPTTLLQLKVESGVTYQLKLAFPVGPGVGLSDTIKSLTLEWSLSEMNSPVAFQQPSLKFENVPVEVLPGEAKGQEQLVDVTTVWRVLQMGSYCTVKFGNGATSTFTQGDAYSWRCSVTDLAGRRTDHPLDMNDACRVQHGAGVKAVVDDIKEPSSWHCVQH